MPTFDLDDFLAACSAAIDDADRVGAVKDVLDRAATERTGIAAALGAPSRGSLSALHHGPDLTVLNVVWTPGMVIEPHDHDMLASIVVYEGGEDNAFFRKLDDGGIEAAGGRRLDAGEVAVLGPQVVHRVRAHPDRYTGAIHVYAGDFFDRQRATWSEETLRPVTDDRPPAKLFEEAEAAYAARASDL